MKAHLIGAFVAAGLAFGSITQAGTVGPELQAAVDGSQFQGDVPVIIRFADEVDLKALRKEVLRTLKEQYPDPKERKAARKKLKRAMLVDALKQQAKNSKTLVRTFLKAQGAPRKLKSLWARNSVAGSVPARLVDALANLPGVESVVLDAKIQAPGPGTAPAGPRNWNLDHTGVPALWNEGHTGTGVVVATMDTGVDASHPDLGPRFRGGAGDWFDPYDQHAAPADNNGHGTQVLGLIVGGSAGGYQVGMAPDAQWIAAKIFDDSDEATLSGIHEAFQWALDPDGDALTDDTPDVVNNSWDMGATVNQCVQEFAIDISLLKEAEIAVVFAGGNYGPDVDTSVSPANDPAVLSVGAVDAYDNVDVLSSRGVNACDGGVYPSLVAPGDGVLTTARMPGFYSVVGGTSFAVAHLAGGVALLQGAFPEATVSQIEASLIESAVDHGPSGPDDDFGHGMMDVAAAYSALGAMVGGIDPTAGGEPGSLQFGAAEYSVDESTATLTVTVTRSDGTSGDVSVDYGSTEGSASAGADYQVSADTLVLLDGEASKTFEITIQDDAIFEGNEDFNLILSNPQGGATLGATQSAVVTILDDDAPIADGDEDGVGDVFDLCPGTPAGESVDANGCSTSQLDGDEDGVSDALDQCPGTPAGESVDASGCSTSQLDGDGDGVSDALDQCPGTPAGESVDANGCSTSQLDGDEDGVSDALDQCPGTPAGDPVDASGCPVGPVDGDGDGFAADADCNDADASVYPGAQEVKHDGVDQDCNGYDLTIDVTRAIYQTATEKPVIYATSMLGGAAALKVTFQGAGGESLTKNMTWNASKARWQKAIKNFATRFGFVPVSVTVSGTEGAETATVTQK